LYLDRVRAAAPRYGFGADAAYVTDVATGIVNGVGVENLAIKAGLWDTETIVVAPHGREVANDCEEIVGAAAPAKEREDTGVRVVNFQPFETRPFEFHLVERWFLGV